MDDPLKWIGIVLACVALVGLVWLYMAMRVFLQQHSEHQSRALATVGRDNRAIMKNQKAIAKNQRVIDQNQRQMAASMVDSEQSFDSVITRLSFTESLDADRFARVSRQCALEHVNSMLASRAGDGVSVVVNTIEMTGGGVELTVGASKHGAELLHAGKVILTKDSESGRRFAQLRDAKTGRVFENMKEVPSKVASKIGKVTAVVVGAAHIISGADISKRLKNVERKLDLLLAFRQVDQVGKLESIYLAAKELGVGSMTREKRWELWRLRKDLRELRCTWRREMEHHLNAVDDPESRNYFVRKFTRQKTSDRQVRDQIDETRIQLGLLEYSMRLDQVLAVGSGMVDEYERSLASELHSLDDVVQLLEDKSEYIRCNNNEISVKPMVEGLRSIVRGYESLLPESNAKQLVGASR